MFLCFCRKNPARYRALPSVDSLEAPSPPIALNARPMGSVTSSSAMPRSAPPIRPESPPPETRTTHTSPLHAQHERLILELLPFKNGAQFQDWLRSPVVQGAWAEFRGAFLKRDGDDGPEPDKETVAKMARDMINAKSPRFLTYHPDKSTWATEDHYIRFIAIVIQDNLLTGLWSESEWKKKSTDIAKAVYEVLFFLKATAFMEQQSPPSYTQ